MPPPLTSEVDRDILCPICLQIIKGAFSTACGHSFCSTCIVSHLRNKSDCPCCSHFLAIDHIYPNFLLNKLLVKTSAHQIAKASGPLEPLRRAVEQSLSSLLEEKKSKMELEESETNLQMLYFLHCLEKQKVKELNQIQTDLQYIKEDIQAVERRQVELYQRRDRYSTELGMLVDDPSSKSEWPSRTDKHSGATIPGATVPPGQCHMSSGGLQDRKADAKFSSSHLILRKELYSWLDTQNLAQSGLTLAKMWVHAQTVC